MKKNKIEKLMDWIWIALFVLMGLVWEVIAAFGTLNRFNGIFLATFFLVYSVGFVLMNTKYNDLLNDYLELDFKSFKHISEMRSEYLKSIDAQLKRNEDLELEVERLTKIVKQNQAAAENVKSSKYTKKA